MNLPSIVVCFVVLRLSGLFENQAAGNFDWKHSYDGNVRQLGFHTNNIIGVLVVATDSNVFAGLDPDFGEIMWRNAFERDEIRKDRDLRVSWRHSISTTVTAQVFVRMWEMVLVCAGGRRLHLLDLGEQSGWYSKELTGVVVQTFAETCVVFDVEIGDGTARLNSTVTGMLEEVRVGLAVNPDAAFVVTQGCLKEGSRGRGYCRAYIIEFEFTSESIVISHTMGERRGRAETVLALYEKDSCQLVMQDAILVSVTPEGNFFFLREECLSSVDIVQMVGVGTIEDKYEVHRPTYSGNIFDHQLLVKIFVSRIKLQVSQFQSIVLAITEFRLSSASESNPVEGGDKFGLKKAVIGMTEPGNIFAFDSKADFFILWQIEKVHSAGRVMADGLVLFKYMIHNLALVLSEGLKSSIKSIITMQLMDLIAGNVLLSTTHGVVHSENWAIYSSYDDRAEQRHDVLQHG